jgi:hypothetical protein
MKTAGLISVATVLLEEKNNGVAVGV